MYILSKRKFRICLLRLRLLLVSFLGVLIVCKTRKHTANKINEATLKKTPTIDYELPPWLTSKHVQEFNEELLKTEDSINEYGSKSTCQIPHLPLINPDIAHILRKELKPYNCETARFPLIFKSTLYPTPKLIPLKNREQVYSAYGVTRCCMRRIKDFIGKNESGYVDYGEACFPLGFENENDVPKSWMFLVIECEFILSKHKETRNIDVHSFIRSDLTQSPASRNQVKGPNVIMFGFDSTSRPNFHRVFPEVHEFLLQNLSAVEVKKYHKVGSNTFPNLGPLLTNQRVRYCGKGNFTKCGNYLGCETSDLTYDDCPFIWKKFKAAGYKTFYGEDFGLSTETYFWKNGFRKPPTDIFLRPTTFTASTTIGHDGFGHSRPKYVCPLCFGPKPAFKVLLNGLKQFLVKSNMENSNYFALLFSSSATHDEVTGGRLIMQDLMELLEYLKLNGYLDNTVFIMFSDHGNRHGGIRHHFQGYIEERLPLFYMALPNGLLNGYTNQYKNLIQNAKDRLVTHFDIHETLLDLVPTSKIRNLQSDVSTRGPGISLFSEIPTSRTCETASILKEFCACNSRLSPIATNDTRIINATLQAVQSINKLLRNQRKCAKLLLRSILNAGAILNSDTNNTDTYRIVFVTIPGNANFEAFFRPHDASSSNNYEPLSIDYKPDEFQGSIERINIYRDDSWCIQDKRFKPFCYCGNLENASNL